MMAMRALDMDMNASAGDARSVVAATIRYGAAAHYMALTGQSPSQARVDDDRDFDKHVFAAILAVAAAEAGPAGPRTGLGSADLKALVERWFSHVRAPGPASYAGEAGLDDETGMVRDLLLANRTALTDDSHWLASMIARRAMEPNHLWEDLGLRNRSELSRLLMRHFAPLARRNVRNMRWKRFFYRMLCEADGMVMCTTPVCSSCSDFDLCFGREDGESRMAYRRRRLETAAVEEPASRS